jgi:peptide/nickel transport system substrate-binding protein
MLSKTMRGALIVLTAIAATACGSSSGSGTHSSASAGTSTASSAAPHSSLALTYSQPAANSANVSSITWDLPNGEPTTIDPVKAGDYGPDMIASNLCDDLFRLDPHWGQAPELAQSYHYADGNKTLVLNIRPGVKFWDGHGLTAADVAYSLQRNMNSNTGAVNGGFFTTVASIEQTGPYQVTVHFKAPDELFYKELATVVGAVVEKAYVQKVGDKAFGSAKAGVMCSGPYELTKWTPGTQMVLTRNPRYWDTNLHAHIQTVTVKFLSDSSTLTSALTSGEVDGAYEVPAVAVPALKNASQGRLYYGPSLQIEQFEAARPTGLGANENVRHALGLIMDRAAIAQKIYNGAATPNLALTPPGAWEPSSARSIYQQAYSQLGSTQPNLAEAKKVVADVPDKSQPIVLAILAGNQTEANLATLIQQYAAQIGLHVQIKQLQPLDFSNVFYIASYRKGLDFVMSSGYLDIPDQLDYLAYWIYPSSAFNWEGYRDPTVDSLANQALATFDPSARAKLLVQAQARYMHNNDIVVPILALDEVSYISRKLAGATTSFAYLFEPSFAYLGAA